MKKKFLIAFLLIGTLNLSGCFGSDNEENTEPKPESKAGIYVTAEFEIKKPDSWEVFQKKDFTSDVPPNTQAVIRSKQKNEIFIANVSVIKNFLPEGMTQKDYAKKIMESHRVALQNFEELDQAEDDNGIITLFQGKRAAGEPLLKFVQKITIKEKSAFIATASFITNEDEQVAKEAQEIARSLKVL